jgi:hypothetical protein
MHLLASGTGLLQKGLKLIPTATVLNGRLQLPGDVVQMQRGTSCDAKRKIIGQSFGDIFRFALNGTRFANFAGPWVASRHNTATAC